MQGRIFIRYTVFYIATTLSGVSVFSRESEVEHAKTFFVSILFMRYIYCYIINDIYYTRSRTGYDVYNVPHDSYYNYVTRSSILQM